MCPCVALLTDCSVIAPSPARRVEVGEEVRDETFRCCELVGFFVAATVPMFSLAGFVVVADQAVSLPALEQAVTEQML